MGRRGGQRERKIEQGSPSSVSSGVTSDLRQDREQEVTQSVAATTTNKTTTVATGSSPSSSSSCVSNLDEAECQQPQRRSSSKRGGADLELRLLNLIRRFYLEALSRLATVDLHARGILVAGQCFGPLSPVDNILASAIWYDAAFPLRPFLPTNTTFFEVSYSSIERVAYRSLQGLLACLRHACPSLSVDDALWHLHLARADLTAALASATASAPPTHDAFLAAAQAAHHPVPHAMALFAYFIFPKVYNVVARILGNSPVLSVPDMDTLSAMLVAFPVPKELSPPPPVVSTRVANYIKCSMETSIRSQQAMRRMIDFALLKHARQTGQHYDLLFICGSNLVLGACKMYYHINFLARSKDHLRLPALLFFLEVTPSSDLQEKHITLCCPLTSSTAGGCRACLRSGDAIYHPIGKEYEESMGYDDDRDHSVEVSYEWKCPLHLDYIFFDAERDWTTVNWIAKILPKQTSDEDDDNTYVAFVREM